MYPKHLTSDSAVHKLQEILKGVPAAGELGVVIARHGAGKTPFVVGIALDHLIRSERVLHVSLDQKVDHVREFYEQIFIENLRSAKLEAGPGALLEMERSRRIHTYLGSGSFSVEKLAGAVEFMHNHADFDPRVIIIDGYDLTQEQTAADIAALRELAARADATLWMTAVRHRDEEITDPDGIPSPVAEIKELAAAVIDLHTDNGTVKATVLRPPAVRGELPVLLDPTTMRIKPA